MLHLLLSASLLSNPAPCDHFFDGATTADIGHPVCGRDEPSKLDPGGRPVRACRPAKLPKDLRGAAIMDAEILESELNLVGEPPCPVDMHLIIAVHTPPALGYCVCETFPEGVVPPSGAVVCAKVDPADGAVRCFSRNADYRGDDGGALTWWGCRSDMTPCRTGAAAAPLTQREVLAALFKSTGGESSWNRKGGWLGGGDPCEWEGVGCEDDGVVAELDLFLNSLSGTLPSELGDLTALTFLALELNSLSGTLPSQLGELTALRILALSDNSLSGTLPSQLGELTALRDLFLSDNSLSGTLPSQLGELTKLEGCQLAPQATSGFSDGWGSVPAACNGPQM